MSDVKKYPSTIPRCKGVIVEPSNFYSGKAVALNTYYGELVIFSSEEDCISAASELIMPNHFKLDISKAQSVSIFSSNSVDASDTASNQELIATLEREKVSLAVDLEYELSRSAKLQADNELYKYAFEQANNKLADIGQTLYCEGLGVLDWHQDGDIEEFDTIFDDNDWHEVNLDECAEALAATDKGQA